DWLWRLVGRSRGVVLPCATRCRSWVGFAPREGGWGVGLARATSGWVSSRGRAGRVGLAGGLGGSASREGWEGRPRGRAGRVGLRSEEHTAELQSREKLVCRLLLEK